MYIARYVTPARPAFMPLGLAGIVKKAAPGRDEKKDDQNNRWYHPSVHNRSSVFLLIG
jgi:hypothetical protein